MSIELKIKANTLAAEAKIIRVQENRLRRRIDRAKARERNHDKIHATWLKLKDHRRLVVRRVARHTHLARNFLRGTAYRRVEAKTHNHPNWVEVEKMVKRYGEGDERELLQRFAEWIETE